MINFFKNYWILIIIALILIVVIYIIAKNWSVITTTVSVPVAPTIPAQSSIVSVSSTNNSTGASNIDYATTDYVNQLQNEALNL